MEQFAKLVDTILESTQDDKFKDFLETRKAGAKKIQEAATSKGGPATLTAQHFRAKERPYKIAIEEVHDKDREKIYARHAEECLRKLRGWKKMSQKEFQTIMGELEVWGEVYIKSVGD
jgi:hypothetical protein